jgi:hypothetical protein
MIVPAIQSDHFGMSGEISRDNHPIIARIPAIENEVSKSMVGVAFHVEKLRSISCNMLAQASYLQ